MAEWSNALVLKTSEGHTSGGSNPSFSAKVKTHNDSCGFFVFKSVENLFSKAIENKKPNKRSLFWVLTFAQEPHFGINEVNPPLGMWNNRISNFSRSCWFIGFDIRSGLPSGINEVNPDVRPKS